MMDGVELSVTWSSKRQGPTVDRTPVEVLGRLPVVQEGGLPKAV
jgi:hypothetical protein